MALSPLHRCRVPFRQRGFACGASKHETSLGAHKQGRAPERNRGFFRMHREISPPFRTRAVQYTSTVPEEIGNIKKKDSQFLPSHLLSSHPFHSFHRGCGEGQRFSSKLHMRCRHYSIRPRFFPSFSESQRHIVGYADHETRTP